jgi:hypothetical protein
MTVADLRGARERKRRELSRRRPKGGQRSLRDVAAELERLGYVNQPHQVSGTTFLCGCSVTVSGKQI